MGYSIAAAVTRIRYRVRKERAFVLLRSVRFLFFWNYLVPPSRNLIEILPAFGICKLTKKAMGRFAARYLLLFYVGRGRR